MVDLWQGLYWRLKTVANNKNGGGCNGVALVDFSLFITDGELKGFTKPERKSLEPRGFDCTLLDIEPVPGGWDGVIMALKRQRVPVVCRTLVIKDGEPRGWLRSDIIKVKNGARSG